MSGPEENITGEASGKLPLIAVSDFPRLWKDFDQEDFRVTKTTLTEQDVAQELGVPTSIVAELENVCSVDTLHSPLTKNNKMDSHYSIIDGTIPEGGDQLHTVRSRVLNIQKHGPTYDVSKKRYFHYDFPEPKVECDQPVALLSVYVTISNKVPQYARLTKHDKEFLVHADQPLTALKDKLACPLDLVYLCGECSEFPDTADDTKAQDMYKSSFFFIENVFYNDTRDPAATDISKPIRSWVQQGKSNIIQDEVSCAKMEETTFKGLKIRLGYPYLYVHQGDCEHHVIFTDVRFLHGDDCQDLAQYPIITSQSIYYKTTCMGCKTLTAKWMTQDDSLAPADPSFFCDVCYYKFHYDTKGNKVGTFRAYRHIDPSVFR